MFRMPRSFVLVGAAVMLFAGSGCRGTDESAKAPSASSPATTARPSASSASPTARHSRPPTARPSAPATSSAARPTHHARTSPARPKLAGPGATCGTLTTPARTAARVVIGHGHMRCAEALHTVKRYYRGVRHGHGGGNAAALKVGRFFCASATAAKAQTGALGSCNTTGRHLTIKIEAQHDID